MRDTSTSVLSPRLRRALLAATGVVALTVASLGSTEVVDARPLIGVDVTATATPAEALVGETVTVAGRVTTRFLEVTVDDDTAVAGCAAGDDVANAIDCTPLATGDVEIVVDDVAAGSATLDGSAAFSWSTDELPVGAHEIVVTYSSEDYDEPGASDPVTVTIVQADPPGAAYGGGGSTTSVTAGGEVTVTGDGWQADTSVTVTLRSDPVVLGTVAIGSTGAFSQTYRIPASTPAGAHTITLDGTATDGRATSVVLSLQVVAAAGQPAAAPTSAAPAPADVPSSLSFTG